MTAKTKPAPQRLTDLRGATVQCLRCDQAQPATGATKFRAHWVCAGCTTKLQTASQTQTKADK